MTGFWPQHQASLIIFQSVLLLIALSNCWALRRMGKSPQPKCWPRVSILVPARNEETNIGPCVRSLLAQDYPNFEVVVLDDDSSDSTPYVLNELATEDKRLRVLKGQQLPADWLGKHWACHQLAQEANGELLLFTDADTRHHPLALRDGVSALQTERSDLLTAIPCEELVSWGERLIVPIFLWAIFCFLPIALANRLRMPSLSAAVGQFMLFRRAAYESVGGHSAVRAHAADDLALSRRIKSAGLRLTVVDGTRRVRCRMYHNFREVWEGYGKNLFAAFNYNAMLFVFVWLYLTVLFWEPLVVLALALAGLPTGELLPGLAAISVALSLLLWGLAYARMGVSLYLALFYPISILLVLAIAARSLWLTLSGRAVWKGRTLDRPRPRS